MALENPHEYRILLIIPAWNEETTIGHLLQRLQSLSIPNLQVLVIDDGSTDQTRLRCQQAGISVLTQVTNLGYGYALQTGYRMARQYNFDVVLQMDGDGQHDPESIPTILQPVLLNEADVCIGSRALSSVSYPMPLARRIGQRVFSWMLKRLCGLEIHDPTSGFQALNRKALRLYLSDEFPGDYPDTNMLLYLNLHGVSIKEAPATFRINEAGKSMHSGFLKPLYYIYKMSLSMLLITLKFKRTRKALSGL